MSKSIEPTPCAVCGGDAGKGRTWCEPCLDKWMADTILFWTTEKKLLKAIIEVNTEKGVSKP